ncbi:MAG: hypothetical protein COA73_13170 [Candidatus Hydrogenedentota bacterium]|nr:MAG: hypothetical protein COA73_13170 [Candidatus Hydrogenedentota bacterium]
MSKILLVGDDWASLERLGAVMEGFGYSIEIILESVDVERAIEADSNISMVVLQENMPVLNGYEVADLLRGNPDVSPSLPIVLFVHEYPPYRKLEGAGISEVLHVDAELHDMQECIIRHMEQYA